MTTLEKTTSQRNHISDGAISALKWLALLSMTYDHVVRFVLFGQNPSEATAFGRIAFPLFAAILAFNLSRPGVGSGTYRRVIIRLIGFGILATPAYWMLPIFSGGLRLNILFTLAVAVGAVWALEAIPRRSGFLVAGVLVVAAGFLVEYSWAGLALVLIHIIWFRERSSLFAAIVLLAFGYVWLAYSGGNLWVLVALPLILVAPKCTGIREEFFPRWKWFFYSFYPAHLTLIVIARQLLGW